MATCCNFCFILASVGFLPVFSPSFLLAPFLMQLLFHEALLEDERQRSQEMLVNKNTSLEGYEIRFEVEDVTCLPSHPIARSG